RPRPPTLFPYTTLFRSLPRRLDPGDPGGLHLHHRGLLLDLADPTSAPVPAGGRRDGVDYTVEHAGDRLLIVHNDGHRGFALAQADRKSTRLNSSHVSIS